MLLEGLLTPLQAFSSRLLSRCHMQPLADLLLGTAPCNAKLSAKISKMLEGAVDIVGHTFISKAFSGKLAYG